MFSQEFECHLKGNFHVLPSFLSETITATAAFRVLMLGKLFASLYIFILTSTFTIQGLYYPHILSKETEVQEKIKKQRSKISLTTLTRFRQGKKISTMPWVCEKCTKVMLKLVAAGYQKHRVNKKLYPANIYFFWL